MGKKRLKDEHQRFVVQCLARFESPQAVAALVKEKFQVELTRQAVEAYDPTKAAGLDLREGLRALFFTERDAYGAAVSAVGLSHKAIRLQALERLLKKSEDQQNFRWASHFIKQAKEEVEGVQTGKSEPPARGTPKGLPVLKVTFEHEPGDSSQSQAPAQTDSSVRVEGD